MSSSGSYFNFILLASLSLLLLVNTQQESLPYSGTDCSVTFPSINSSYNLCHLKLGDTSGSKQYYQVKDARYNSDYDSTYYKYYFNIGGSLPVLPSICSNNNTFDIHNYNKNITITTPWAVQVEYNNNDIAINCWYLSSDTGGPPEWSLIHNTDPSAGVQLIYLNGDYDDLNCETNRKFIINFECENNIDFMPEDEILHEYNLCEYTLNIPSSEGCPIQCRRYNYEICGGNGLCGYDFTNNIPSCFCYYKYNGDDCSNYNPNEIIPDNSNKQPPNSPYIIRFNSDDTGSVDVVYDFSEYALDNGAYVVHEKNINPDDIQYVYYVGIPNKLIPDDGNNNGGIVPSFCNNALNKCSKINETSRKCLDDNQDTYLNSSAYVFQVDYVNEECFALGTDFSAELYDQYDDPARGVSIIYSNGSWCSEVGINREFRINLICPMDQDGVYNPSSETNITSYFVEEDDVDKCLYSFTIESAIACPYQCKTNTSVTDPDNDNDNRELFTVCSQHGICAADPNAKFVRCLCDDGYESYFNCDNTLSPTTNPTFQPTINPTNVTAEIPIYISGKTDNQYIAVIIILIVILIIIFICIYYCFKRFRLKYNILQTKVDDLEYQKFSGKTSDNNNNNKQNIIIDNKGKPGFATIDQNIGNDDDDDDDSDD